MKLQNLILWVLWIITILFAGYKYNANINSKINTLQKLTIDGRIESNKKEHDALMKLKNAFNNAWGDKRLQELQDQNDLLRSLNTTGSNVITNSTTGDSLEKTQ